MKNEPDLGGHRISRREGQFLLKKILPEALALAAKTEISFETELGPLASILSQEDFDEIKLIESAGGYEVALTLKNMPPFFPNMLQARGVFDSLSDAEDAGLALTAAVLCASKAPFIVLDGYRISLSRSILNSLKTKQAEVVAQYPDLSGLKERISKITQETFPNGFGSDSLNALAPQTRNVFITLLHIGAFMGVGSITSI